MRPLSKERREGQGCLLRDIRNRCYQYTLELLQVMFLPGDSVILYFDAKVWQFEVNSA